MPCLVLGNSSQETRLILDLSNPQNNPSPLYTLFFVDASIHDLIRPSLVQVMACHIFDTKPLPKPMLVNIASVGHISSKFE